MSDAEEEPEEPQSWFAKMERSTMLPALASDANKVVAGVRHQLRSVLRHRSV